MKTAIYPGSFDPITNGHLDILKRSLETFDEVIVLVADNPYKKVRFKSEERVSMIRDAIKDIKGARVDFTHGQVVDYANSVATNHLIRGYRNSDDMPFENEIAAVYKKQNPNINIMYLKSNADLSSVSSTMIDEMIRSGRDVSKFVPASVVKMYQKK